MAAPIRCFSQLVKSFSPTTLSSTQLCTPPLLSSISHISPFIDSKRKYSKRNTRRRERHIIDPRTNIQYPYVRGDPLQEECIEDLNVLQNDEDKVRKTISKRNAFDDKRNRARMKEMNSTQKTESGLKFEKLQEGDLRFGRTILDAKSGHSKENSGNILLEGQRLIRDALLLGAEVRMLYFTDSNLLKGLPEELLKGTKLYKVTYRDMKTWSDTVTPSGLLGVFKKPEQGEVVASGGSVLPITVIFDNLRDPGNAGTLLRTAAAVGCERVLATRGCVNVWESKVLRSAMGGHFCIPIYTGVSWQDVASYLREDTRVFLANARKDHSVLGRARTLATEDDLQQQGEDSDEDDSSSEEDSDDEGLLARRNELREARAEMKARPFHRAAIPLRDYANLDLTATKTSVEEPELQGVSEVALILGGETQGLSAQAKKFTYEHYGEFVTIAMNPTVDSLNTAIAGSVILYEIRRKMLQIRQQHEVR